MRHELYRLQTQWGSVVVKDAAGCEWNSGVLRRSQEKTRKADRKWRGWWNTWAEERRCFWGKSEGTRGHWSQMVVWGWGVGGRRSGRTVKASAATVPITRAVVRGTWSIAYQTPSRAGEQETGRQGSTVILQPHLVSELRKMTRDCAWITSQAPPPTEVVSTSHPLTQSQRLFTGNDDCKKSSLGPEKPLGKEEQVLRGCKGWG